MRKISASHITYVQLTNWRIKIVNSKCLEVHNSISFNLGLQPCFKDHGRMAKCDSNNSTLFDELHFEQVGSNGVPASHLIKIQQVPPLLNARVYFENSLPFVSQRFVFIRIFVFCRIQFINLSNLQYEWCQSLSHWWCPGPENCRRHICTWWLELAWVSNSWCPNCKHSALDLWILASCTDRSSRTRVK